MIMDDKAIGIFDSGIGGLTVVKQMRRLLPFEKIIYFGDTARVPYGTKSARTIIKYATEIGDFLAGRNIKMLILACNTTSTYALEILRVRYEFPVLGVIEPGAEAALSTTKNNKIALIGTSATIKGNAYDEALKTKNKRINLKKIACPLFVPIVEEGLYNSVIAQKATEMYLSPLLNNGIDTLILGCTHYPLLKQTITNFLGQDINLVDSAEATALCVQQYLKDNDMLSSGQEQENIDIFVSDLQDNFRNIAKIFLDQNHIKIKEVITGEQN